MAKRGAMKVVSKVIIKEATEADLKVFAEELMAQIGPKPSNWNDIVEVAIKKYKQKQKEV